MKQQNKRPDTENELKPFPGDDQGPSIDIIQQTRKRVKDLTQSQRFRVAKLHLMNALSERSPRLDTYSNNLTRRFKLCYSIQTSNSWQRFLLAISYIFMYLIIWGFKPVPLYIIAVEIIILLFAWMDVIMEIYHKKFQVLRISSRFQLRFYARTVVLMLLVIDEVLVFIAPDWKIRPLIIFRCLLPLFYDFNARKAFQALLSSYKDILVFLVFYSFVILTFSIIAHQIILLPKHVQVDPLQSDYRNLGKTLFMMYVLATYDNYPDYQMVAIHTSLWIYGYFILFIILNVFFFTNIPVTLIFNSFRQTRSKIILVDQIKQQHSLIMSFVSLGQENLSISVEKLIEFLLYVYKYKARYLDHIGKICRQLDEYNNGVISVNQYMQLCKILQADSSMLPPAFHDWKRWSKFQRNINCIFGLRKLVLSNTFKVVSGLIISLTFINGILSLYTSFKIFDIIDDFMIFLYIIEIFMKMIGLGFQMFFQDPWNKLDLGIILFGFFIQVAPENIVPRNSAALFKMARIFRIASLIKVISINRKQTNEIYQKATKLMSQTAIIIPTILRFLPFYLITFYSISIIAMSIFQQSRIQNTSQSPYSDNQQFANFKTFIFSHFLLVQILVQSSWSMIAYNHVYKYGSYVFVMLFFVLTHVLIVTILSSLVKGVIWEIYNTIAEQFNQRASRRLKAKAHEQALQKKRAQIQEIRAKIEQKQVLIPDNLITKQLYENKIDLEILQSLVQIYRKNPVIFASKGRVRRSELFNGIIQDRKILIDQISQLSSRKSNFNIKKNSNTHLQSSKPLGSSQKILTSPKSMKIRRTPSIQQIQDLHQEDIQQQMQRMLGQVILHQKIKYSATIVHPEVLQAFLIKKLKQPKTNKNKNKFDIGQDMISNKQSVTFFTHGLNALLGIQVSQRQQKMMIIQNMIKYGMVTEQDSVNLLKKKPITKDSDFDSNWVMRKAFLADTNENMIKKLQIQYFSDVYGKSFKQINKVTIQPLLQLQCRLTYCLRNALRYSQMGQHQFFTILSSIQNTISNILLKQGSLFKFVYQINSVQYWFSIDLMESHELRLRFLKNGIWIKSRSMEPNQVYVASDIFKWDDIDKREDRQLCEKYIKMLFQSFESLAFSLDSTSHFFQQDPRKQIYDLFTIFREVHNTPRKLKQNISISKIMLVILSKQDQRNEPLQYTLSNIKRDEQKIKLKKELNFKFDETEKQTYQKLKKLQLMDYQKIVGKEGIPFAYIMNLIKQIQEIVLVNEQNFVFQVQSLFNQKFQEQLGQVRIQD